MVKLFKTHSLWWIAGSTLALGVIILAVILAVTSDSPAAGPDRPTTVELSDQTSLPLGGRIVVQLREAGVDGPLVAEQIVANPTPSDRQFTISHNPQDLDNGQNYYLRVEIYDAAGQLLFLGSAPYSPESPARVKEVHRVVDDSQATDISQATDAVDGQADNREPPPAGQNKPPPETTPDPAQPTPTTQPQPTTGQTQATAKVRIHFDQNYSLPAGARLSVSLRHLGQLGDSTNQIIAQAGIVDPGPPPVAVELSYDPARAPATSRYLVTAAIDRPDGKTLMTSSQFGFEIKLSRVNNLDVYLVAIRPDQEKTPDELDAAVSGTIRYQKSCQLPAGSKLSIRLLGNVNLADAPTPIIAETEIVDPGPSPVEFELKYDSSDIETWVAYSLSGRIEDPGGRLLFVTDTVYEVITRGQPNRINLPLVKVRDC